VSTHMLQAKGCKYVTLEQTRVPLHTQRHTRAHLQCDDTLEAAVAVVRDACGLVQAVGHQRVLHGVHESGAQLVVLDLD